MNPRVVKVAPLQNYILEIDFDNGERKQFDTKPYLERGAFVELKEQSMFYSVKPFLGSIQWINGLDFCPDTLYEEGTTVI